MNARPEDLRVAVLIVDDREEGGLQNPKFGAAPTALLEGLGYITADAGSGLNVHVVSCVQHALPAPQFLSPGIRYHQLHPPAWSFMRALYIGPVLETQRLFRKIRPHIVHAHGTESWCASVGLFSKSPQVLTLHGCLTLMDKISRLSPRWYWVPHKLIEAVAVRRYAATFCSTPYVYSGMQNLCKSAWLIPNAVRSAFFTLPPQRPSTSTPVFLNVGVVHPRKRQNELCEIFHRLAGAGHSFRVRFIGKCGSSDSYSKTFKAHMQRGANYMEHLVPMPCDELIEEFDNAHALIHTPSEEAFGLVAAEALARNLPAFLSATGGLCDIAKGIPSAIMHKNHEELQRQLSNFLLGIRHTAFDSQRVMKTRFSPEVVARLHMECYRELAASNQCNADLEGRRTTRT